ncbi:Hydroxyacid oxidase 2 [Labeo rohita]|uniref:Hydroxyacid oxidase 2 n=1 Tax=Labeo rohita TaxID=84645 RepID=A0ABQ8L612_LABRO|nr:Hydroxyacid oxidase 2 [Labeo rohita]
MRMVSSSILSFLNPTEDFFFFSGGGKSTIVGHMINYPSCSIPTLFRCLARDNIICDVDKNMWPNGEDCMK